MMQRLDAEPTIKSWDYECVRIPYYYGENKRWYVPDFIVTFADNHREMWEVKPKAFHESEKVRLKAEAARAFCVEHDINLYRLLAPHDFS